MPSNPGTTATTNMNKDEAIGGGTVKHDEPLYDAKALQYVEPTQTSLQCTICYEYFTDPVSSPCGHTFCHACIRQALEVNPGCPLCRTAIDPSSLYEVIALSRICDELLVYCPHKSLGCGHICQRTQIGQHLKDDCNYIGTMCRIEECRKKLLKKDLSEHMETCPYKRVDCLMCNTTVQRSQLSEHHKTCPAESVTCPHCNTTRTRLRHLDHLQECPQQVIGCTHAEFGCPWQGPRFELQGLHIPQCPYEAIRGFLTIHKAKVDSLEQENQALRALYYDLRPQVQQLRDQVGYLSEAVQLLTGTSQETGGEASFGFTDTATASQHHHQQRQYAESVQSLHQYNNHQIAAFEPPEHHLHRSLLDNDIGIEYPPRRSISSNVDPLLHHHHLINGTTADDMGDLPDGVGDGIIVENGGLTAGATSRPATTQELLISENERIRSEMETLTAAVASMELKQNMAIMTESIRMQEEIQSLRAVCHGLRMQMHYVLVERQQQQQQQQQQGPPPPPATPPTGAGSGAGNAGATGSARPTGGGGGPKGPGGRPLSMGPGVRPPYLNSTGRQETKL